MRKYRCVVSYLGEAYYGFEKQPHHPSIQQTLEEALTSINGEKTIIKAAGRTDAKVNALGQVFCFTRETKIRNEGKFLFGLNSLLPEDIHIESLEEVDMSFDARHSSVSKIYEYRFSFGERNPFDKGRVAQLGTRPFDVAAFKSVLPIFIGKHDFSSFTTKKEDVWSFIRTIYSIDVKTDEEKKVGTIVFHGDHFMTYQVRIMIGCAIQAAYGKVTLEEVKGRLDNPVRHIFSYKAPAEGLYLVKVNYQ